MRRVGFIGGALLLAACGQSQAPDGYVFAGKEYDRAAVLVKKQEHRSFAELRAALPPRMSRQWKDDHVSRGAWGQLHADGSCTIHFVDPELSYQPEWIGHETAHCFYGNWHPTAPAARS